MTYQDIFSFQTAETDFQDIKWLKSCYLYSGEGGCQNAKFLLKKRVNFDSISAMIPFLPPTGIGVELQVSVLPLLTILLSCSNRDSSKRDLNLRRLNDR